MQNFVKRPRPEPPRVTSFGGFSVNEAFAAVLAIALAGAYQRHREPIRSYPAAGRSSGDRAHKRWKRRRATGRA